MAFGDSWSGRRRDRSRLDHAPTAAHLPLPQPSKFVAPTSSVLYSSYSAVLALKEGNVVHIVRDFWYPGSGKGDTF
jgi:hypothetical protein